MASRSIARTDTVHPRAWGRVALIALALLILIGPHMLWRLFDKHSPVARWFLGFAGWVSGADVSIKGVPDGRYTLFIANHLSWLDILVLSGATGCAFVAKADMAPWPVIGWLATSNNSVYVQREARHSAHHQANALQTALLSGQPVALFPEGTTGNGRQLLPFRTSLIAAVTPAPEAISIQPVALDYGSIAPEIAWTDDEPVGVNALRVLSRPGRFPVIIHFLEPLSHADFADRKAIAAHSCAEIAAALGVS